MTKTVHRRGWRQCIRRSVPGLIKKPSNPAKRQSPKKFTKAEKQVLQILIRNRRKRK